jgi:hypothetical protein
MLGLPTSPGSSAYLYVAGVAASLMLGWAALLAWGSFEPVARRAVLLLALVPVLVGLGVSSVLAVDAGLTDVTHMLPLWVFYALMTPLYAASYRLACRSARAEPHPPAGAGQAECRSRRAGAPW